VSTFPYQYLPRRPRAPRYSPGCLIAAYVASIRQAFTAAAVDDETAEQELGGLERELLKPLARGC
jgi:hypothetical protein